MCSSSVKMFDIISKLEDCLSSDLFNMLCEGGFKFFKVSNNHKVGDYICYASNRQCALPTLSVLEMNFFEIFPWIKDFIKVNVAPHGFALFLSRSGCFLNGLKDVEMLGSKYGYNSMFINKVFRFSVVEKVSHPDSLINLRLKLTENLVKNVICACGGSFDLCNNKVNETISIKVTNKNSYDNDSINIMVGTVITDSPSITLDSYKSIRMTDIMALCDHKLDPVNVLEESNKILNTSIVFDLLQCNVQRSVTLNLNEEESDKKTSCKGSIFVLYNYARLFSLCARFDDEVTAEVYPALPELQNIDFSVLSLDDEWQIMFDLILYWPSVVKKSIIDIKSGRPKLHLILDFLKKMSTTFSQYYHRTRILTEPRIHLLPALFARMRLLKSLLQVYQNAFKLIDVAPLQKM
ncbi:uncharacterized protein [Halyomorpha halys]|uniref:uncharacterized protein n=1 Tax=Halyomorpha halys TaxID=286706 RepID=UPI0006D4EA0C|nr:uncharacterized protein LOC106683430 [Halyomorpha halys]XP_024218091.1 uncharacterized protein LOC106683430 [Halyomorpha halys]